MRFFLRCMNCGKKAMEFRDMPKPQQPIDASDVIKMNGEGYLPGQIPSCCNCKQNIIPENLKMENVISEE